MQRIEKRFLEESIGSELRSSHFQLYCSTNHHRISVSRLKRRLNTFRVVAAFLFSPRATVSPASDCGIWWLCRTFCARFGRSYWRSCLWHQVVSVVCCLYVCLSIVAHVLWLNGTFYQKTESVNSVALWLPCGTKSNPLTNSYFPKQTIDLFISNTIQRLARWPRVTFAILSLILAFQSSVYGNVTTSV